MAGVWEALFYEEKQDWISFLVNGVFTMANLAVELPCTLMCLISTGLVLAYDYLCQGASQVSDLLGLEEWWSLEHTLWTLMILQALPIIKKKANGNKVVATSYFLLMVQVLSMWGSVLFMLNGLQGGVVFGGKFYHPTLGFLALLVQVIMMTFQQFHCDLVGFGPGKVMDNERYNDVLGIYKKMTNFEGAGLLLVATFGLPQFDLNGDPKTWLLALPVLGIAYNHKSMTDILTASTDEKAPAETTVDANGTPPQVTDAPAEEKKEEKPVEKKPEEESQEGEKKDETKEETKPEEKKVSVLTQALEFSCGLVCKCLSTCQSCVNKVLEMVNLVKDKILSLPWGCLCNLLSTVGLTLAMTFAFWTLTEDPLVFVAPSVSILAPILIEKLQNKEILDANSAHVTSELLKTVTLGVHYYIHRSHISMPI